VKRVSLASEIERTPVPAGSVALWWLAQAGFVFKAGDGTTLYLDPYFSNVVEKAFGFKRLSLCPVDADDVRADWLISSHEHLDHLDTEALPIIAKNNSRCRFAGSESCQAEYAKCGVDASRTLCLSPGAEYSLGGVTVHCARADHGDLSPSALSLLLDFGKVRVLFTGDTSFRPDWIQPLIDLKPDVLLPCINGKFGNLNSLQAALLTAIAKPRLVIPCHFWMFMEHGGDPESFMQACKSECPAVRAQLLSPGEGLVVSESEIAKIVLD
jgi:L-ascorbate 6-phosphate lactonase